MRIWHKDLIPVLPRKQLLGQWRELCLIAKNISEKGTPNHILVNRVMNYPLSHLFSYGILVRNEMKRMGYKCDFGKFEKWFNYRNRIIVKKSLIFKNWHERVYLSICYCNLAEKYMCDGISEDEWRSIQNMISIVIK